MHTPTHLRQSHIRTTLPTWLAAATLLLFVLFCSGSMLLGMLVLHTRLPW